MTVVQKANKTKTIKVTYTGPFISMGSASMDSTNC
jgi:hypothetical protein